MDIKQYLESEREAINAQLDALLPGEEVEPRTIHRAIRYSVFAGGKRLRPILVLATGESMGGSRELLLPVACAVEMIHTYSLIHDDLPALDNDDLRRGRPTCHKVFGEAIAILAGDALMTIAFETLSSIAADDSYQRRALEAIREISAAAGTRGGMIGGQVVDIESTGKKVTPETIEYIHNAKTASLIAASVNCGAIIAGAGERERRLLSSYGRKLGFAFQIIDDILDLESTSQQLGKTAGKDLRQKKATYPAVWGLEYSKRRADELIESAVAELAQLGPRVQRLIEIARYIGSRKS